MTQKQTIVLIAGIAAIPVLAIIGVAIFMVTQGNLKIGSSAISNFEECAASGQPVMESYPRQCSYAGQTYSEDIGNILEKQDLIRVTNVTPNQTISSPVAITGEARGTWFFEASFPITVEDENGNQIGLGIATATSDWMTENFVPFTASISFTTPTTSRGTLIFHKDNPSGLPENDDTLEIPVIF
ncbi:MAG: Gmad2 immunoglobulin-like domain-containing protein [Patescibacteria group bacterium]|jgi:hypothetical protein